MTLAAIDAARLIARIRELGRVGRDERGRLTRLAATDADKAGRDRLVAWMRAAGLEAHCDRVGNLFGVWRPEGVADAQPVVVGSHIDTVIDAGIYDGCAGALSGLEAIESLREAGFRPARPIATAAFTNEEGVRFAPDMLGSLVYAGGLMLDEALARKATDGERLGDALERIGYAGADEPGFLKPHAYVELHVEQGPVLDREGVAIGAVEGVQGISWRRATIEGAANHAGTTPMAMRRDAGLAAARVIAFLRDHVAAFNAPSVATVGCLAFEPNAINVIPSRATFTIDLRDPDERRLERMEAALGAFLERVAAEENVSVAVEPLARFAPVAFDPAIVAAIEEAARRRGLSVKRMVSGAGHDAQMMARLCPAAMIFVPSVDGVSHSPKEFTREADLVAGANVLTDVVARLAGG